MRRKITVSPNEPPKDAELIQVVTSNEPFNEYILADGTLIKTKAVMVEVWRLIDEYDQEGNPRYVIKAGNVVNITSPDELKRPE